MPVNDNLTKTYCWFKRSISNPLQSKEELAKALRLAGLNPTRKALNQYWSESNGSCSFEEFVQLVDQENPFRVESLLRAFTRLGGTQAGLLSYETLKRALSSTGDSLDEDELAVLFGEQAHVSGQVDYLRLTSAVLVTLAMVAKPAQCPGNDQNDQTDSNQTGRIISSRSFTSARDIDRSENFSESSNNFLVPNEYRFWHSVCVGGSLFAQDEGNYFGHQYVLTLEIDTDIWLSIRPVSTSNTDLEVFLFSEQEGSGRNLAASTQRKDAVGNYVLEAHLTAGQYLLVPFTSGCRFRSHCFLPSPECPWTPLRLNSGHPTPELVEALRDVFRSSDLDMNGSLSYEEFNLFSAWTNGEMASDDEWDILKSNFQSNQKGELTEEGFLQLHLAQLAQQDGEEELWGTLKRMGFTPSLRKEQACQFAVCIQSETCKAQLHCLPVGPVNATVDRTLCRVLTEQGTLCRVKNMNDLTLHHLALPHRTTYAIRNKSHSPVLIRLDCSNSSNCLSNRGTLDITTQVPPKTCMIGHHLIANDEQMPWTAHCEESFIK